MSMIQTEWVPCNVCHKKMENIPHKSHGTDEWYWCESCRRMMFFAPPITKFIDDLEKSYTEEELIGIDKKE